MVLPREMQLQHNGGWRRCRGRDGGSRGARREVTSTQVSMHWSVRSKESCRTPGLTWTSLRGPAVVAKTDLHLEGCSALSHRTLKSPEELYTISTPGLRLQEFCFS